MDTNLKNILTIALSVTVMATTGIFPIGCTETAGEDGLPTPEGTYLLYPQGQNTDAGLDGACGPLLSNGMTEPEVNIEGGLHISHISDSARFDLYLPEKPNGQMVVICPGGGYHAVSAYNEGIYVAKWMLEQGIAAAILKYRFPYGHWEVPLVDVQNTFRFCRKHAAEWGVSQIGVMGFSAGGHLAGCASNLYTDDVTRPDFSILMYPVVTMGASTHLGSKNNLLGTEESWKSRKDLKTYEALSERYSMEKQVTSRTPATFIVHCADDTVVPVANSTDYYDSLVSHKVPVEMHLYPTGDHGWGFNAEKYVGKGNDRFSYARKDFESALARWLKLIRN